MTLNTDITNLNTDITNYSEEELYDLYVNSCNIADLHTLQMIYNTGRFGAFRIKDSSYKENISLIQNQGFRIACKKGHIDIVKYLLTSSDIKYPIDMYSEDDRLESGFTHACKNGHIEIVKYLLTSPELKEHIDLSLDKDNYAFSLSCERYQLDVIKYLLTSPDLKQHINIHTNEDEAFEQAFSFYNLYNNSTFIDYLIYDLNIDITPHIQDFIENKTEIKNKFELRSLNETLNNGLSLNTDIIIKNIKHKL